jgi:GT2 family glycosyltransferase
LESQRLIALPTGGRPLISVVVPVRNVAVALLEATSESVRAQSCSSWELCLVDDASTDASVGDYLRALARADARVKVELLNEQRGISGATNVAIGLAEGEFIAFLDNDDLLHHDALAAVVETIGYHPDVDVLYSDEDKIGLDGKLEDPYFKPDWAPDLLLACMYVGHLLVVRKALIEAVGGLRPEFDGSQDYDLILRVLERTSRVHHIPRVLYHWRRVPGSTAARYQSKPYAHLAARSALTEALTRRGLNACVEDGLDIGTFRVRYALPVKRRVSIIIPTRDRVGLLRKCIASLERTVDFAFAELLVIDNGSVEADTHAYLCELATRPYARVIACPGAFNFSKINNSAVAHATGDLLLFLNNDTQASAPGWLESMIEHAQRHEVGAVGCRLLYPGRRRRIQHAGVVLGMRGVAGHAHRHRRSSDSNFYGPNRVTNYSAVTAACMMMRRELFEEVGGFDEKFAVAFNDVDLCLRLRQLGLQIVYTPYATLIHHESVSVGHPVHGRRVDASEIQRMFARWDRLLRTDPFYNPNLPLDHEDFASVVRRTYRLGASASLSRLVLDLAHTPWRPLLQMGIQVLRSEGPASLTRDAVRYFRSRV